MENELYEMRKQQEQPDLELQKRQAQSRTVIIENLPLDLGITEKDIFKFIRERLLTLGERGDLDIVDIDMNPFSNKLNNNSVSVQVADVFMVARLKRLDETMCLGQKLRVRKINEESSQTNAQASAIAIQALLALQGKGKNGQDPIDAVTASLKTLTPSPIIKISNVHNRNEELTAEAYNELLEDMEDELEEIPNLKRIKIVRNG